MASPLKVRGLLELGQLRDRARRQHLLKRISRKDCEWLVARLNEIEAYITNMNESTKGQNCD